MSEKLGYGQGHMQMGMAEKKGLLNDVQVVSP